MAPSQVDGCSIVNLDDVFEAVDKQMQISQTHWKHQKNNGNWARRGKEHYPDNGNTSQHNYLQFLTCTCMRSWLKAVDKGVSLSLKLENISFQQLVN